MSRVLYYNSDGTPMSYLTQWDKNISLVVKGADVTSVPDFHFSNKNSKKALVVKSTIDGEDLYAQIPNALLQEGLPITVHIYYTSEDGSSRTKYSVTIHVVSRAEPNDYEYSDSGFQYSDCIQVDGDIVINDVDPGGTSLLWVDTSGFN